MPLTTMTVVVSVAALALGAWAAYRTRRRLAARLDEATAAARELACFLDASPDAVLVTAPDGEPVYSTPRFRALPEGFGRLLAGEAGEAYRAARGRLLDRGAGAPPETEALSIEAASRTLQLRLSAFSHAGRLLVLHTVTDVTGSREALEAEAVARRESLQREFVANVSHELRTPVAAIRGFAETLRLGALNEPDVAAEFVETIERHAERLHRLIEDLLEVSTIEAGRRLPRPVPIELAPFVWEFYKRLAPLAERKRLRLRATLEPGLRLFMDEQHLGQVLTNLCDNAVKFNRRCGSVLIESRLEGDHAVVSVHDTGPGIEPDQLPVLFDRFHWKTRPPAPGLQTTGLGLSIVKRLLELNQGTIWAQSSGKGASFHFRVPAARQGALARVNAP